jgi:TonB family protein
MVNVIVGPDGRVAGASAISGPEMLRSAAVTTVRQWRFEPPAAETATQVTITFRP